MDYKQKFAKWINYRELDSEVRAELKSIENEDGEIKERFYADLIFGTGGLRGVIGAGTAYMNIYTIRHATQGLAAYINRYKPEGDGVAIAYDSRHMSARFALETACVLTANGIKAYLFNALRPTPELSFAVRHLGCTAGVVITASHNPAKYNGYKAYGPDGGQLTLESANAVIEEIQKIDIFEGVKLMSEAEAVQKGLLEYIGAEVDEAYYEKVLEQQINPITNGDSFKVVYTPFHGAGNKPVREILSRIGLRNVLVVREQEQPDGAFPTVKSPNPEEREGFRLAIELARAEGVDLIIGTDPDSDRMGVMIRTKQGEYITLSGNQIGVLLTHYILSQRTEKGNMPPNPAVIKTVVTTRMLLPVAAKYGASLIDVLTGFKFIGEKIKEFEESDTSYVFGFEESYGYLAGTYCRDKDAVVASMLTAEMAAFYQTKGMTLYDALEGLYKEFGRYDEATVSIFVEGVDGVEKIKGYMDRMRSAIPAELAGVRVISYSDYQSGMFHDLVSGASAPTGLPGSNVLIFNLQDEAWIALRPSGTEPKFKIYFGVKGAEQQEINSKIETYTAAIRGALGL